MSSSEAAVAVTQEMGSGGGDAGVKDDHHSDDRNKKKRGKRGGERVRGGHGHQHQVAAAKERRAAKRMKQASDTSADVAEHLRAEKELMLESMLRISIGRCYTSQPAAERLCADDDVLEAVKQDCCTLPAASDMMPADMRRLHEELKAAQLELGRWRRVEVRFTPEVIDVDAGVVTSGSVHVHETSAEEAERELPLADAFSASSSNSMARLIKVKQEKSEEEEERQYVESELNLHTVFIGRLHDKLDDLKALALEAGADAAAVRGILEQV